MEIEKRFYEKTDYPEIYRHIYWGGFKGRILEEDIIKNRNNFIKNYKIKMILNRNIKKLNIEFEYLSNLSKIRCDHIEEYECKENYVLVFSPYWNNDYLEYKKIIINNGWVEIDPLYSLRSKTFFKIIPKKIKKK